MTLLALGRRGRLGLIRILSWTRFVSSRRWCSLGPPCLVRTLAIFDLDERRFCCIGEIHFLTNKIILPNFQYNQ